MENYGNVKKIEIKRFVGKWIELKKMILNGMVQTQKDRHFLFSLTGSSSLQPGVTAVTRKERETSVRCWGIIEGNNREK